MGKCEREKGSALPVPLGAFDDWLSAMRAAAWDLRDPVQRATGLAELEHPATLRMLLAAFKAGANAARAPARLAALSEAADAANQGSFNGQAVLAVVQLLFEEQAIAGTCPSTNSEVVQ